MLAAKLLAGLTAVRMRARWAKVASAGSRLFKAVIVARYARKWVHGIYCNRKSCAGARGRGYPRWVVECLQARHATYLPSMLVRLYVGTYVPIHVTKEASAETGVGIPDSGVGFGRGINTPARCGVGG